MRVYVPSLLRLKYPTSRLGCRGDSSGETSRRCSWPIRGTHDERHLLGNVAVSVPHARLGGCPRQSCSSPITVTIERRAPDYATVLLEAIVCSPYAHGANRHGLRS